MLSVREDQTTAARIDFTVAHHEVEQLVLGGPGSWRLAKRSRSSPNASRSKYSYISATKKGQPSCCAATSRAIR